MSGIDAQRGFIYQSLVAMIECLERNDWDEVKLEPETAEDKVDIQLYKSGMTKSAIQVKSSKNKFQRSDVKTWIDNINKDAPNAEEKCIYLVGDEFTPVCEDYISKNSQSVKKVSFEHLEEICIGKLTRFIMAEGYGKNVRISDLELINASIFSKIHKNSIHNERLSREEFKLAFLSALPIENIGRIENVGRNNLYDDDIPTVFISYNNKQDAFVDELESKLQNDARIIRYTHKDSTGVGPWEDFREFMKKIRQQDFAVLILSEDYLKSDNCIYEVMQLWKDEKSWDEKVMYIVIDENTIYDPTKRLKYVEYWQSKYQEYIKLTNGIDIVNTGSISDQARQYQTNAANIGKFLSKVASANNPPKEEAAERIIERIKRTINTSITVSKQSSTNELESFGIISETVDCFFKEANKSICIRGVLPHIKNNFQTFWDVDFRTSMAKDVTVKLNHKYVYEELLPLNIRKSELSTRPYLSLNGKGTYIFTTFDTNIILQQEEAEILCGLIDSCCEKTFKSLVEITQNYNLNDFVLNKGRVLLLKLDRKRCNILFDYIINHSNYKNYDLSESRSDGIKLIKIQESNHYHGILYCTERIDGSKFDDNNCYIYENISYYENDYEPIWSPHQIKEFLLELIEIALVCYYSKTIKKSPFSQKQSLKEEVQKDIDNINQMNQIESLFSIEEIDSCNKLNNCVDTMIYYFSGDSMLNSYNVSKSIYKPIKYLTDKYNIEKEDETYIYPELGLDIGSSKEELSKRITKMADAKLNTYTRYEIRSVLRVLQCFTENRYHLGFNDVRSIVIGLQEIIEIYNREILIKKYID